MPANVGNQKIALKFYDAANSSEVNERFKDIRQKGIYLGGRLSIIDSSNAQLSPLVCEISDGSHQVRVETTIAVNLAVAQATPYVILRWTYTGAQIDYMEILTIATPATNDLIVGKCSFGGGGALQGFSYDERKTPNTLDLFLKVESTEVTELRVRVRAGKIQMVSGVIDIPDQKSDLFIAPTSNNRIDLVYIKVSTGAVKIKQGNEAVSPVPPNYGGVETKIGLAEVLLTPSSTNITASMIKDVRNFITPPSEPDGVTLERSSSGKWQVIPKSIGSGQLSDPNIEVIDADVNTDYVRNYTGKVKIECFYTGYKATETSISVNFKVDGASVKNFSQSINYRNWPSLIAAYYGSKSGNFTFRCDTTNLTQKALQFVVMKY